jgi:hypothetical protein
MFITNFKRMLLALPDSDEGHAVFMAHIANKEAVIKPAAEFFDRITTYALIKTQASVPLRRPNPRMLITALAIQRFPIEMLHTTEEPLQFSLINKTENLLETLDRILHEHNPEEDDTAPDLIPADTTALFLTALIEYHAAWVEWSAHDAKVLDARIDAGLQRLQSGLRDVETSMIYGDE